MTHEEFLDKYCNLCGTQRCYGEEYCGLYQHYVLGADSPWTSARAAKQQLLIHKISEDTKSTEEVAPHWVRVPTDRIIDEPDRVRWKCSSCGKETDLPNYEKANFCFNCGVKML